MLAAVPEERRSDCWWIVLRDGTPIEGDRGGGVQLLSALTLTRAIGRTLGWLRLSAVVDLVDIVVARNRKHLSRMVPDGPAPLRFP